MKSSVDLLEYLKTVQIGPHILRGRRGAEENVKIKIVIPLLQSIGWNILSDMDFEYKGLDLVLMYQNKPAVVVEIKSWGVDLGEHLNQCVEYCLKTGTPWIIASNGQQTVIYSCLSFKEKILDFEPLVTFRFEDFLGPKGYVYLEMFDNLIGKEQYAAGFSQIKKLLFDRIGGSSIEEAEIYFTERAEGYTGGGHKVTSVHPEMGDFKDLV
jgi:hypothetical protein